MSVNIMGCSEKVLKKCLDTSAVLLNCPKTLR